MAIKDNIKKKRKERKMTLEDVAKIVGVTRQTVQKYESGVVSNIPSDKIELLAKALHTTPAYIMGWESDEQDFLSVPNIEPMPQLKKVPLLGTIACGKPILDEENIEGYVDVPTYVKCDFTLKCKGDSMVNARIYDGDIVCVKQQPIVENGEIAAVLIDNEVALKRFYKYDDLVILMADSQNFKDLEFRKNQIDDICVIGKATHFISLVK